MKIFKIVDEELDMLIGTLLYYKKCHDFIIELVDTLDEWTAPLLLTGYVKKGIYTIPRDVSLMWVKERIIPSGRQNIGSILSTHNLKQYEEIDFLELSSGRCCQDHMFIKKIDSLPDYVIERMKKNVKECVVLNRDRILCFFMDNTMKKINLKELEHVDEIEKVLKHQPLLQACKVGTGGYSITFDDSIDIPAYELYSAGVSVPLELDDFISFVKKNVLDTADCCDELECSRQNVAYIMKQKQLTPVQKDVRGNLYLKGDVLKNSW